MVIKDAIPSFIPTFTNTSFTGFNIYAITKDITINFNIFLKVLLLNIIAITKPIRTYNIIFL
ncbi:hypothetical protein OPLHCY645_18620 [Clostridium tetani]